VSYQFPLQKIVDYKTNVKQQKQQELAEKLANLDKENKSFLELQKEKQQAESILEKKQTSGTNIQDLQSFEQYVTLLREKVEKQKKEVASAQSAVEEKQGLLKDTAIDEKTWLWMRDKKKEEYEQNNKLQEQLLMDELASTRFYAKK
jgi:flagellar protein FliJ